MSKEELDLDFDDNLDKDANIFGITDTQPSAEAQPAGSLIVPCSPITSFQPGVPAPNMTGQAEVSITGNESLRGCVFACLEMFEFKLSPLSQDYCYWARKYLDGQVDYLETRVLLNLLQKERGYWNARAHLTGYKSSERAELLRLRSLSVAAIQTCVKMILNRFEQKKNDVWLERFLKYLKNAQGDDLNELLGQAQGYRTSLHYAREQERK